MEGEGLDIDSEHGAFLAVILEEIGAEHFPMAT
jgi:hypothetical protein